MAFTVAIDGPAAAGKGTIGRAVAAEYGLAHLDTGLLYRAVALRVLQGTRPEEAARALTAMDIEVPGLRAPEVSQEASRIAVLPAVREALADFQRAFARRNGGAVLDGRDIGTVICPEAEAKLFVTASPEVRAERRFRELRQGGTDTTFERVLEDVKARDARDTSRSAAPLRPAEDAVTLDTSLMSVEDAVRAAIREVGRRFG